MKIIQTEIEGLLIIETPYFSDERGGFMKIFNHDFFHQNNLSCDFKEFYFSVSKKNVIRGMHFQTPPFAHTKLVYCSKGSLLDVVVDLTAVDVYFERGEQILKQRAKIKAQSLAQRRLNYQINRENMTILNFNS